MVAKKAQSKTKKPLRAKKAIKRKAGRPSAAKLTPMEKKIERDLEPVLREEIRHDIESDIQKEVVSEVKETIEEEEEDNMLKIAISVILSTILTALIAGAVWWFNPLPASQITLIAIVVWIIITIVAYFFQSK